MKYFGLAALAGALGTAMALALPDGYAHNHGVVKPGPAVEYTYPAKMPVAKCGHQLLVGCQAQHSVVPCNAHAHEPAHHYPAPAPKVHYKAAPEPHQEAANEPMVQGKHKHRKHHKHHHHGHHHHGHHHQGHHNKFHHHHHHHHHHHRH